MGRKCDESWAKRIKDFWVCQKKIHLINLSMKGAVLQRAKCWPIYCYSCFQRSFLLFFIGIALNTLGTDARLANIRVFGILQRFGIAYMVIALMYTLKIHRKLGVVTVRSCQYVTILAYSLHSLPKSNEISSRTFCFQVFTSNLYSRSWVKTLECGSYKL